MTNKVEAVFYNDNNSIVTIDDSILLKAKTLLSAAKSSLGVNYISISTRQEENTTNSRGSKKILVASSISIESLLSY